MVMVRRAFNVTKSLLPLATGAVASPVTFRRTISSLIGVEKPTVAIRNILPAAASRFFSGAATASNIDIYRRIDSEPPLGFGIPLGTPFEILKKCTLAEGEVIYHYKHNGEYVLVKVTAETAAALDVCILKQRARTLLAFDITALKGEIRIERLEFGDLNCYHDPRDCRGVPGNFNHFDEDLKAAFYKYLAVRGITAYWYVENNVLYFR